MKHRFFDIVVESDTGDVPVNQEYVLDLPEHSMETPMERQEFLGVMFDTVVAASGLNICSFSSEEITNEV